LVFGESVVNDAVIFLINLKALFIAADIISSHS
jgi:hypothetical protein